MLSYSQNRMIGQHIGNYRLLSWLGQGSFADVYLGEHILLKRLAAIKILKVSLPDKERENFLKEARMVAKLDHPHIIRVLECGFDDTRPFLIMNYASKGSLSQRYPPGTRLSPVQVLPYVQQAAAALHYAHQQKLIHRDVKPENMLLDDHSQLLLSDFGLALIYQSIDPQTSREMAGTVTYMAPEQLQGQAQFASDQYALGIVTYEWLCGERPFDGSFVEVASQHMLVPPPPLREKVPTLSAEVEQVVLRALSKDPTQRFVDIEAFAGALADAIAEHPSVATTLNPPMSPDSDLSEGMPSLSASNHVSSAIEQIEATSDTPGQQKDTDTPGPAEPSSPTFAETPPVSPLSPPASPPHISLPKKIRPTRHRKPTLLLFGLLIFLTCSVSLSYVIVVNKVSPPNIQMLIPSLSTNQASIGTPNPKRAGQGGTGTTSPDTRTTGNTTATSTVSNATATPNSSPSPTPTPNPAGDCILATPLSLAFTSLNPAAQTVTVTNCGNAPSSLGYTTNSNWILVSSCLSNLRISCQPGSTINSKASIILTIEVNSSKIGLGDHSGSVDLSLGTDHQAIAVTYKVTIHEGG